MEGPPTISYVYHLFWDDDHKLGFEVGRLPRPRNDNSECDNENNYTFDYTYDYTYDHTV